MARTITPMAARGFLSIQAQDFIEDRIFGKLHLYAVHS